MPVKKQRKSLNMPSQIPSLNGSSFFIKIHVFLYYIKIQFLKNDCFSSAAALSYTSLLAFVPLLSLSFSVISSFPSLSNIKSHVLNYLFSHLLLDSNPVLIENFSAFISRTQHLDVVGVILLVFSSMFVFGTIEKNFNIIWAVQSPRTFLQRLLSFWALLTLGPLIASLGINVLLAFFGEISHYTHFFENPIASRISLFLPFLILSIIFTFIYLIVPNHKVRIRDAVLGAVICAFILEVSRHLFIAYINYIPSYKFIYKTLSVLPLFIVWMYIFWSVILFGAQVTASLPDWKNLPPLKFLFFFSTERILLNALHIVACLMSNRQGILISDILSFIKIGRNEAEQIIHKFYEAHIMEESHNGLSFLIADPKTTTLYDLYRALGYGVYDTKLTTQTLWKTPWKTKALHTIESVQKAEMSALDITLENFFNPTPSSLKK